MPILVEGPEGETVILPSGASAAAQQSARLGGEASARAQMEKEESYKREFEQHGRYLTAPQPPAVVSRPSSQYIREQEEKRQAAQRETQRKTAEREQIQRAATRVSPAAGEITRAVLPTPVETEPSPGGGILASILRTISNILYPPQPQAQTAQTAPVSTETGYVVIPRQMAPGAYGQFITIGGAALAKLIAELILAAAAGYAAMKVAEEIQASQAGELTQEEINEIARAVKDSLVAEGFNEEIARRAFETEAKDEEDLKDLIREALAEMVTTERIVDAVQNRIPVSPPPKRRFWQRINEKLREYGPTIKVIGEAVFAVFIVVESVQIVSILDFTVTKGAESLLWTARNQIDSADDAMKKGNMEIADRTITDLQRSIGIIEGYRAAHGEFADALDAEIVRLKTEHDRLQDEYSSIFELYPLRGRVIKVNDGDTFVIETGESVRIRGIEAPERGQTGPAPFNYTWRECTDLLTGLIIDQDVDLEIDPNEPRDAYGRILARVIRSDGLDVGEEMIALGAARRRG